MVSIPGFSSIQLIYEGKTNLIYQGTRDLDGKSVILKTIYPQHGDKSILSQIIHEHTILTHLNNYQTNSHVVQLLDLVYQNNIPFIVTETAGDMSLRVYLSKAPLSLDDFFLLARQLVQAIHEIHTQNITHRDIKPDNIMIEEATKSLKLIDFSAATRMSQNVGEDNPDLEFAKGSLSYMSPEQTGRLNRVVDYRTDFYSLGITFYEMLAGKLPFQKKDPLELIYAHLAEDPVPLSIINPDIPMQLSSFILKLMAKTPEERYSGTIGILADLDNCQQQWTSTRSISPFPLGSQDKQDKLKLSQKLYGRTEEINELLSIYEETNKHHTASLLLLAGSPGIGKTSLIKELYKPIVGDKGYFIEGKFDQHQRSIPYGAFIEAFDQLIHRILKEPKEKLNIIKQNLLRELRGNGQLIIDVIPSLELLIGPQPPLPDVTPHAIQNRFMYTIQNFVRILSQPRHPLILFIDDWQWADSASLNLLKILLIDSGIKNLFIIASYRDDKKDAIAPFQLTIDILKQQRTNIHKIKLHPLKIEHIQELLRDTLNLPSKELMKLSEIFLEKTQGNPFFINIFLETLYKNHLIIFDQKTQRWKWEEHLIKEQSHTTNVLSYIADKIYQLPPETQEILKIAACIGHTFDAYLIAHVLNMPLSRILKELSICIENSFISSLKNNHEFYEAVENSEVYKKIIKQNQYQENTPAKSAFQKINYRFNHDRIQQACSALLTDEDLKRVHISIGRYLRDHPLLDDSGAQLAETVNHLNFGADLVEDPQERQQIAELNLTVGKRAKAASAYELSSAYFLSGIGHLSTDAWETHYALMFDLYHEFAHSQFLCGEFTQAEKLFMLLLSKAQTKEDKISIYLSLGRLYVGKPDYPTCIKYINKALELLGHKLPTKISKIGLLFKMIHVKWLLRGKSAEDLINIPEIQDKESMRILHIYSMLGMSSVLADRYLFITIILNSLRIIIQQGNSPTSIIAYIGYAFIILRNRIYCSEKQENEALKFVDIGMRLFEKYNLKSVKLELYFYYAIAFHARRHPISSCYDYFNEAYLASREEGNLTFAAQNLQHMENALFLSGTPIPKVLDSIKTMIEGVNISNGREEMGCLLLSKQFHQTLLNDHSQNESENNGTNSPQWHFEKFKGRELADYPLDKTLYKVPVHYNHRRSFYSFLMGDYEDSLWHFEQLDKIKKMKYPATLFIWINYYFIQPLAMMALYNKVPFTTKLVYYWKIQQFRKILKVRAKNNPENHLNKYYLVEAEWARINNNTKWAIQYYSRSIKAAEQYNLLHEEAIAYELKGKYFLELEGVASAMNSLSFAYHKFNEWGAKAKTKLMLETYPELINENLMMSKSTPEQNVLELDTLTSNTIMSDTILNIASIMKACQAISSEIEISKLLEILLTVLLENAGAQRVVLISQTKEYWGIEAEGTVEQKNIYENPIPSLETRIDLPQSLISYVQYTKKHLIIKNATAAGHSDIDDPYFKNNKVKSVLLLPLLYQGQVRHIFYMENNAIAGIFTSDRLQTIQFLASQAAISLENAHLYNQATHDPLTGLGNRNLLYNLFPACVSRAKRENTLLALIFIDLDFFKTINDTLGHEVGDEVLIQVSKILKSCVRESDLVVRLGGDEFVLLIEGVESKQAIKEIAERFLQTIEKPLMIKTHSIILSASVGISMFPKDGTEIQDLMKKADISLYKVKESGRSRFDFYTSGEESSPETK